ncbi:hypothetical protein Ddye_027556 [Dipteronia dyeriana]|uniref:Uncharacterized protein n=1 Tax=Dipteronia dyeriana TaxID=168575 RepID=A0AAD9TPJ0_9ROSI|nr:hypothetical protein Ddye_027556 [Dipteronia dyeriana]
MHQHYPHSTAATALGTYRFALADFVYVKATMSVSTNCVHGFSPLTSLNSQPKQHKQYKLSTLVNDKLLPLSTTKTTTFALQSRHQRTASLRKNAVLDPDSILVVGATSPAKSGDITVFLITSAGFIFLYWVTNFVVPDIVSKKFELGKENDDQKKK